MIYHLVLFKFKEDAPLDEFKKEIENLQNLIPEIVEIKAGKDIGFDKTASDFAVFTKLKDEKGLEIYATHPKHLKVIEFLKPYVIERKAVDFKVG